MKRSQMRLFYKAITIVSFLSIALIAHDLNAVTLGSSSAKQIGFRVANSGANNAAAPSQGIIDQPPVVIQGRSGNANAPAAPRAPQAQTSARASATPSAPSMAMEPVVEGFGDKVPLTVAIQQILPQGYGYTLGDGVDAGQLVSWRGGRPWSAVLQDMLGQAGLSYAVNGRSVAINGNGASPAIISGTPRAMPQPAPVVVQQPVVMDPQPMPMDTQPVMQQQPQMVMQQPQPQIIMQQPVTQPQPMQPVMMQPQPQMVMQQPVMMQPQMQPMMMPQGQQMVMMQQPMMQVAPAPVAGPQPLQIENPLVFQSQTWEARPGQTLRALLQEWCTRVGVELNWTAEFDYPIMASMNMTGTFEEAVRVLLIGFDGAKPTPRGRLHYNPAAGQSILIVEANGNHYGD